MRRIFESKRLCRWIDGRKSYIICTLETRRKHRLQIVWKYYNNKRGIKGEHIRSNRQVNIILMIYFYYIQGVWKKVIKLWSALVRSLYNLQKSFFYSRKEQAFSFRMLPFLWHLKKHWANTNQKKIAGRNRILSLLSIIITANKKQYSLIIYLSRQTINVANKMH